MGHPVIDGLTFVRQLGSGGFADVYLYEQVSPRRQVAVKVLRSQLNDQQVSDLGVEADMLAKLEHPHIVPIYASGRTGDGREYLSMMYYPVGSLDTRLRGGQFSVTEVLRLGVQLSGALETAHQAGILHLDIKPVNVLVDKYGQPGLADFGIARSMSTVTKQLESLSLPWAAPELVSGRGSPSVYSDIYSLAATLWHLLAGHSPFVYPGGNNTLEIIAGRVLAGQIAPFGRTDVPPNVIQWLRQAMSVNPGDRPASMADFAYGLQQIESQLRLPVTSLIVPESDLTRASGSLQSVDEWISQTNLVPRRFDQVVPQTPGSQTPVPPSPYTQVRSNTPVLPQPYTQVRSNTPMPQSAPLNPARSKLVSSWLVGPLVLAIVAGLAIWLWPTAKTQVAGISVSGTGHEVTAVAEGQAKMTSAGGIKPASPLFSVSGGTFPATVTWAPNGPSGAPSSGPAPAGDLVFLTRANDKAGWRGTRAKWQNGVATASMPNAGDGWFIYKGSVLDIYRTHIEALVAEPYPDKGCPQRLTAKVSGTTYQLRPDAYSIRGCLVARNDQAWFQLYNFGNGYVWRVEPDPKAIQIQPSSAEGNLVGEVALATRGAVAGNLNDKYATLPLHGLTTLTMFPSTKANQVKVTRDRGLSWVTAHVHGIDRTVAQLTSGTALLTKENVGNFGQNLGRCVGSQAKAAVNNENQETGEIVKAVNDCVADELAGSGGGNSDVALKAAVLAAYAPEANQIIADLWGPGLSRNLEGTIYIEVE